MPVTPEFAVDVGVDVRQARGSTQEKFTFVAPAFTRVRDAGGEQVVAGGFAEANWTPRADVTITGAARVDHWRQDEGHRREVVIADGSVARDDRYAVRQGTVSNFRLGGRVDVSSAWSLRATGYTGFRIPTLNELYRPFRVGNDITEANPTLRPERLYGIEAGARWAVTTEIALDVTVFAARLRDAVGNVTVRSAPGLDPVLNVVVPAGGVLRQRRNIDRVHSEGIETELTWRARDNISLTARYLYTAPTISRSASQPALEGLDLAQVARHQATFSVSWQPWNGATWRAEGLLASGQFDDDQNTRRLSGYATVDLYLEQAVSERVAVYARGDNLFDRTIEAGRSADGLVTVGTPRAATVGFRVKL